MRPQLISLPFLVVTLTACGARPSAGGDTAHACYPSTADITQSQVPAELHPEALVVLTGARQARGVWADGSEEPVTVVTRILDTWQRRSNDGADCTSRERQSRYTASIVTTVQSESGLLDIEWTEAVVLEEREPDSGPDLRRPTLVSPHQSAGAPAIQDATSSETRPADGVRVSLTLTPPGEDVLGSAHLVWFEHPDAEPPETDKTEDVLTLDPAG